MIIDDLKNLKNYESVNPLFPKVIEFLKNNDLNTMEPGKYEIEGKDLFVNITKIPITGAETFGYTPRENLPAAEYNAEKDITKIPDLAAESYITCQPGMMAIFFPQDGHAPCITGAPEIKKAIFKVKA